MNPGDIIVIIVVLVGVFFALRHVFRRLQQVNTASRANS